MKIILNGEAQDLAGPNLAEALEQAGLTGRFATALNEAFVPSHMRAQTLLKDGDRIEALSPMQGG
ncbi:MAG: sulfur carrier protein ThiS [Pseudomonadota bacterium]